MGTNVTTEFAYDNGKTRHSLKLWLLERAQAWINAWLEAEMTKPRKGLVFTNSSGLRWTPFSGQE